MEIGRIIKELREDLGKTQGELAEMLKEHGINTSAQNISYWEKGRQPSIEVIVVLSNIFNVTIEYLIGVSPYKKREDEMQLKEFLPNKYPTNRETVNCIKPIAVILDVLGVLNPKSHEYMIKYLNLSQRIFAAQYRYLDAKSKIKNLNDDTSYDEFKKIKSFTSRENVLQAIISLYIDINKLLLDIISELKENELFDSLSDEDLKKLEIYDFKMVMKDYYKKFPENAISLDKLDGLAEEIYNRNHKKEKDE